MDSRWIPMVFLVMTVVIVTADPIRNRSKRADDTTTACGPETDLVFVLDSSGSIKLENWPKVLNFVKRVVEMLQVGEYAVRIGIVTFGNRAYPQFDLNTYSNKEDILNAIDGIQYKDENTNTSGALRYMCGTMFTPERGDRANARNMAFVMTDGKSSIEYDGHLTIIEARIARDKGISIFSIGVGDQYDREELNGISGEPGRSENMTGVPTIDGMPAVIDADDFDSLEEIESRVVAGTRGCGPCREHNDVAVLIDTSGSMINHYSNIIHLLQCLVLDHIQIGEEHTHIAVITYADVAKVQCYLGEHQSSEAMAEGLGTMEAVRGTSNAANAFEIVQNEIFNEANGHRPEKRRVIILVTDGNSDNMEATLRAADVVKRDGIDIVVVSIGGWVNLVEVEAIASDPDDMNVIHVRDSQNITDHVYQLKDILCNSADFCSTNPCKNGGSCVTLTNNYFCNCLPQYIGKNCDTFCPSEANIVFLVDASSSWGTVKFHKVVKAVSQLAASFHSADSSIQVAIEVFSEDAFMAYDINADTADRARKSALTLPYFGGPTKTDNGLNTLNYYLDIFDPSSTKNRVAILVTDGKSTNYTETLRAAAESHRIGVHLTAIAVDVKDNEGQLELRAIASDANEHNIFSFSSIEELFANISGVFDNVKEAVCNLIDDCATAPCQNGGTCINGIYTYECRCRVGFTGKHCERECDGVVDLVIVWDASGSIRENRFKRQKEWMKNLLDNYEINTERTRVALVVFSDQASVQFDLHTYTQKQDVLQAVESVVYIRGRTNIADAIRTVRRVHRQSARVFVPKVAVLVTDGQATTNIDRTLPEAIAARVDGIHLIVVGVETEATDLMFRGIASDPDHAHFIAVSSYNDLPERLDDVVAATCNDVDECSANPCLNGGTCYEGFKRYDCVCSHDYSGLNCERECTAINDIAIIMDTSGSTQASFEMALNLTKEIAVEVNLASDRSRMSVTTFGTTAILRFGLTEFLNRREIINAIEFEHTSGKTNLNNPLALVYSDVLTSAGGDRFGVPNRVVVISDFYDYIEVSEATSIATQMKNEGVDIFTIAIGQQVDFGRQTDLASNPKSEHTFHARDQSDVPSVAKLLADHICL